MFMYVKVHSSIYKTVQRVFPVNHCSALDVCILLVSSSLAHTCRPCRIRWLGLEKLSGYSSHLKPFEAPRSVAIACFYITVFLFFEMAWDYCSEMLAPAMTGEGRGVEGERRVRGEGRVRGGGWRGRGG